MAAKRSNLDVKNSSKVLKKKPKIDQTSTRSTKTRTFLKPKSEIKEKLIEEKTVNEKVSKSLSVVKVQSPKTSSAPKRSSKRLNPSSVQTSSSKRLNPDARYLQNSIIDFEIAKKLKIEGLPTRYSKHARLSKRNNYDDEQNKKESTTSKRNKTRKAKRPSPDGGKTSEVLDKKPKMDIKENSKVKKSTLELADFSDEILLKIICDLPTKDIFKNVSLVSKKMNNLTKDSTVPICGNFKHSETSAIKIISERARQISKLELSYEKFSAFKLATNKISQMSNLSTIKISTDQQLKRLFPKQFIEALTRMKKLRSVELSGQFEKSCFNKVGELNHLKHFHLVLFNYNITERELKSLAELKDVPSLFVKLSNPSVVVCNSELKILLDNTNGKKKFNHLQFDSYKINELERVLSHFPNVDVFNVVLNYELNEEIILNLKSLFAKCKSLRNVSVCCFKNVLEVFEDNFNDEWILISDSDKEEDGSVPVFYFKKKFL